MTEKSLDEMKAELEAAGIEWRIRCLAWMPVSQGAKEIAIRESYKRYVQEKRYAAMEALLEELINAEADALATNFNWYNHGYNILLDFKTKAEALLNKPSEY